MSDVWQGPGWWLASDGKWYPAEAESGAVYEGEIAQADPSAIETATNAAPVAPVVAPETPSVEPVVAAEPVVVEPVVAAEPVVVDPSVVAAAPLAFEPVAVEPIAVEPIAVEPLAVETPVTEEPMGAAPIAPAPVVAEPAPPVPEAPASTGAGWQAIEETPAAAADDGWTSAFGGSTDQGPAEMAAPPATIPETPTPEVTVPEVTVPEVTVPEVTVPEVTVPEVTVPEVTVPEAPTPDMVPPDATSPFDAAPPLLGSTPAVDIPEVSDPVVEIPEIPAPEPIAPEVPAPASSIPESTISQSDTLAPGDHVPLEPYVAPGTPSTSAEPIERTDAWRRPTNGDLEVTDSGDGSSMALSTTRPDVVDLAIPEPAQTISVEEPSTNWSLIGGAIAAIVLLAAIVWLALQLFSNGSSDSTETDNTATEIEDPTTSEAVTDETADADTDSGAEVEAGDAGPDMVSVFALRDGDCIVGDITGQVLEVERVDCDTEHQFQVYRETIIDDASITEYDEAAITSFAEGVCRAALAALIPADDTRGINFKFLQPTEESWNAENPDRVVTCLLFDDDAPLIGRVG